MAAKAFNAFHDSHLPLPVPTGAYMTVTTRKVISTNAKGLLVGPIRCERISSDTSPSAPANPESWTNTVAVECSDYSLGDGTLLWHNVRAPTSDISGGTEVVPAAVSFKVLNTQSLTEAGGIVYIGRSKTGISHPSETDSRTAADLIRSLVDFANPKEISAAKLAMTTQHVNLVPSNLTELSDFGEFDPTHLYQTDFTDKWGYGGVSTFAADQRTKRDFAGFKPGFIYNPNSAPLVVTVAVEWRVRLAPYNPMHSSLNQYPAAHPGHWQKTVHALENATEHGVEDAGIAGAGAMMASSMGAEGGLMGTFSSVMGSIGGALPEIAEFAPLLLL
jgi:hypothetical protein